MRLLKPQKHQKAILPELLTIALFLTFLGLDPSKGYLLSQSPPARLALPLAHGHCIRSYALTGSGMGVGALGSLAVYAPVGVINDRGLFHRWALLPGNARETWARELLEGLEHVLGDRGGKLGPSGLARWVEGVLTPPYRLRGGQVVETGWRGWMGRVRNWIETRLGVMVRSFGLHRMEARSYWGLVARVNLILLAHNLVRSRVLLKMAGWNFEVANEGLF
nr:transposase [Thermus caliditerrae]